MKKTIVIGLVIGLVLVGCQQNVEVDIRPPDYYFKWNSYTHNVWINEATNRLELSIEAMSNYGVLSSDASEKLYLKC